MTFSSDPAAQINQLPISVEFPRDPERFLESLTNWIKRCTNAMNTKEGALYTLQETFCFKQYFTPNNPNVFRNMYRSVFNLTQLNGGSIAGSATVAFAHNINGLLISGDVVAQCTSTIPTYFSVMGPTSVWLDAVNVNFTNPLATPLNSVIVVAEYLKN